MTNSNKLADECFCDRMYPDSNPNASCGDCPTRDYAPKPTHAPAADGAGELPPLPEPTCLGFRNPCGITQLPDMGIYGYTADQVRACQREAIAALRQPVPDAVREGVLIRQLRGRAAFLRNRGRVKSPALMEEAASRLESAIASQQESRNG